MNIPGGRLAYYTTVASSSVLLFSIQPIITKAILPSFGGSAGVWVTAMLFFQVVLLLGYSYAWGIRRMLPPGMQSLAHGAILIGSLAVLPVKAVANAAWVGAQNPVSSILTVLLLSAGLPFFLLSSTTPLLQSWFSASYSKAFPWRLYAISNAASVGVLLAYPVVIEPHLRVSVQLNWWSIGYAVFVVLACVVAGAHWLMERRSQPPELSDVSPPQPALWVTLAACGSLLWLAVANHLSQEVAPVPFLWVLPLSVYLLSFILCFESERQWYRPRLFRWLLPLAWAAAGYGIASAHGLVWEITVFSGSLFIWCMFCHGELARRKPQDRASMAFFYLMIALGGALGGSFVAIAAPIFFNTYLELPLGIAGSVILAMPLVYGVKSKKRLIRLAAVAAIAFLVSTRFRDLVGSIVHVRNFYGALQVMDSGSGRLAFRSLYNGRTLHGVEFLSNQRSLHPTAYYGPESGVGKVLSAAGTEPRNVGVVGLGAGTLAAYGRKGDTFRFYEINPAVIRISSEYFHFLDRSAGEVLVAAGDGRLLLQKEPSNSFDVLVLDAFSDDSIPVHLMTKEAFGLYFQLLRENGTLAIHLTNRYIDLAPVVDALAAAYHKRVTHVHSSAQPDRQILDADWAIVTGHDETAAPTLKASLWTDDYSNLFQVLK